MDTLTLGLETKLVWLLTCMPRSASLAFGILQLFIGCASFIIRTVLVSQYSAQLRPSGARQMDNPLPNDSPPW